VWKRCRAWKLGAGGRIHMPNLATNNGHHWPVLPVRPGEHRSNSCITLGNNPLNQVFRWFDAVDVAFFVECRGQPLVYKAS
jgi:hypothetical protein